MGTKLCGGCGLTLPLTSFWTSKTGRKAGKPMSRCKTCAKTSSSIWMKTAAGAPAMKARKKYRRRDRAREWLDEQKKGPCVDCGKSFPACAMHFDHVKGDKRASLARLVSNGDSLENLQAEIAKCDLVCACCHAVRSYSREQHALEGRRYKE